VHDSRLEQHLEGVIEEHQNYVGTTSVAQAIEVLGS
jgi:hypothetical protein